MKKILNIISSIALLGGSATSVVACSQTSNAKPNSPSSNVKPNSPSSNVKPNSPSSNVKPISPTPVPSKNLKLDISTELSNFSVPNNYLEVNFAGDAKQSWTDAVKDAVYGYLSNKISGFSNQITKDSVIVNNSNYNGISYETFQPITANIQVDGVEKTIYINTVLAKELKNFISSSVNNHFVGSVQQLKMSDLVTAGFYSNVSKNNLKGFNWLNTTAISTFFDQVLNPFNKNSIAYDIPSVIPKKISATGLFDTSDPNAVQYSKYMSALSDYVSQNLNYNWKNAFSIYNYNSRLFSVSSDMSLYSMAFGLAPDIIHFTNFLKHTLSLQQKQNFTMGEFISCLVKYFFQPIKDYNKDNFSEVDLADKSASKLSTNFDIFAYDLFDNWYSGANKPDYGLTPGANSALHLTKSLSMVNNNGSNTLDPKLDFRTIQQNIDVSALGVYYIGYAQIMIAFSDGFTKDVLKQLFDKLLSPNYGPVGSASDLSITVNINHLGKFSIPLSFQSIHENEFSEFVSKKLNLNPTVSGLSTQFGVSNDKTTNNFQVYYSTDGKNYQLLPAKNTTDFVKFLNSHKVIDYKFVMSGFNSQSTFTTVHKQSISLNFKNNYFDFII